MRSALLDVKGVSRVQLSLETKEAVVTYDPEVTTVEMLIAAVNAAAGPLEPNQYTATVKAP